ncbi:glycosyltransferase [Fibrobacter sp. UWB7]|uniref:glycosyltransferase n=1 Tax=Fibrobacter sp. UWB7 TaxID=1896206 RepID=UPI00092072FF|nr:glycosyltransferase [Fibrobacter sp. UWB7]SHL93730.1 Glycosyltransferase involved in cell wall bisynthesis [Fibrobacter sp. UWB7]
MRVSVAMTTYNGSKYIKEQLNSILNQSKSVDEILIFDDQSTDDTISFVEKIIKEKNVDKCKVYLNKSRMGWKKNFIQAISATTGDIVFLADQDDVWHRQKVELLCAVFEKEKDANLVVCKYQSFLRNNEADIGSFETFFYDKLKYGRMSKKNDWNIHFPGCTYAFRKDFFEQIKTAWFEDVPHDLLIYEASFLCNTTFVCDAVLHFFRRHEDSVTTNAPPILEKENRVELLSNLLKLLTNLVSCGFPFNSPLGDDLRNFLSFRIQWIKRRSLFAFINILKNIFFYRNVRTFLTDCFVALKLK